MKAVLIQLATFAFLLGSITATPFPARKYCTRKHCGGNGGPGGQISGAPSGRPILPSGGPISRNATSIEALATAEVTSTKSSKTSKTKTLKIKTSKTSGVPAITSDDSSQPTASSPGEALPPLTPTGTGTQGPTGGDSDRPTTTSPAATSSLSGGGNGGGSGSSDEPATTSPAATGGSGGGGSGNAPVANGLPASSGSSVLKAVQTIAAGQPFDGKMMMYDRGTSCTGQAEGGDSDAVFILESGASLSNVIIGPNQIEGIHCNGGCTLTNVWWSAVCEDAFSIKKQEAGQTTYVKGGGAFAASDKVVQHNGGGTVSISDFTVEDFGKLYRSCGNCKTMYERHVIMDGISASSGKMLAGLFALSTLLVQITDDF
jgi:pectate lyase